MPDIRYIKAGWLIDGSGGPVQQRVLLTIADGTIVDIGHIDSGIAADSSIVTDLLHCTILPPLVDCHVHLALSSTVNMDARKQQLEAGYEEIHHLITQNIHHHFTHGILAVRDAGDRLGNVLRYTNEHSGIPNDPVVLKTSGRAWYSQGRYGSMLGCHPLENETLFDAVARETDQADFIKIIHSGPNSLSEFGRETPPQFDQDELRQTVRFAEQQGKKVMVHANGKIPVRMALESGCHSIEHGFFMGRENLERMAELQTVWIPTAYAMKICSEMIGTDGIHFTQGIGEKTLHHQLEQISLAKDLGVPIALGTDAGSQGVIHGESVAEEMKLLVMAGYSTPEAVHCATYNGARLLGIDDTMGRIARGMPANFIVARGTPAQLPEKLSHLKAIYLDGDVYDNNFSQKV